MTPTQVESEDRCTCPHRLYKGEVQRVLKKTCPEHGRWAKFARETMDTPAMVPAVERAP